MAAHSLILAPAAYVYLLRPDSDTVGEDAAAASNGAQVLLQLRRNTGYMGEHWTCGVSGHVEAAGSVLEAALRETNRELRIGVEAADLSTLTAIRCTNDLDDAVLEQCIDLFFMLWTWTGTPAVCEPAKNVGLRWFSSADLFEAAPPHERHVLELPAAFLGGGKPVPPIITLGFDEGQDIDRYSVALPH